MTTLEWIITHAILAGILAYGVWLYLKETRR